MEDRKKTKEEEKIEALEKIVRQESLEQIKELLEKIGNHKVVIDKYIDAINSEVSFKISIGNSGKEQ